MRHFLDVETGPTHAVENPVAGADRASKRLFGKLLGLRVGGSDYGAVLRLFQQGYMSSLSPDFAPIKL